MSVREWRHRTFTSLATPNYAKFFVGQALSLVGTWMQSVAVAWLVLQLTHSASMLGITVALQTLPMLLLGPYAGVVADRLNKRVLLIWTNSLSALLSLGLAGLAVTGLDSFRYVLVCVAVLGTINAFDQPTRQAFVREMVNESDVRNAVSLNAVLVNASRAVGPAIGGILIAAIGVSACFIVNAASYLAAIVALASMSVRQLHRVPAPPRAPRQLREGFAYVRRTPALLVPLVMMAIIGTLTYEFQVTLPALATGTFLGDARSLGILTSAMGVGAVVGGLTSATQTAVTRRTLILAAAAFGITVLLTAIAPNVAAAASALVLVGVASAWFMSAGNTALQLVARPEMRGRVMALWSVAFIGSTPIGGPIVGVVAQNAGARWALAIGALAALVAALVGLADPRRSPIGTG